MRGAFAKTLVELAAQDDRIMLLTGDLGFMALEIFSERFPSRFVNMGVAEQNMMGVATGLAEAGFIPFAYSIVTFASLRPYEFIRNGPIFHHLPVRVVGVGGGMEYGNAGPTHHGLEDVSVMRTQPGITVIAPADADQTASALRQTWHLPGPIYYRIGKNDKVIIPNLDGRFELGRLQIVREGGDLLLVAMGGITNEVVAAADTLAKQGIQATVAIVSSFNPAPVDDLIRLLGRFPLTLTVEAHYITGGVGSLVSEVVAEQALGCRVVRCGLTTPPLAVSGSQSYLQHQYGISASALVETALRELQGIKTQ
ncbi:MAG: 1-deoxy-D-xylulose-5-phosphate synthase [Chloroflexi bacterium]|nr:1-deoxy-D-xylulose-5-phosphate synthase [Chloroflexota bacterium]